MEKETALYSTQNLYEAAYCLFKGLELAGKETVGSKTIVYFKGTNAKNIAMGYYQSGEKQILDCYRSIKDYAYKEKIAH